MFGRKKKEEIPTECMGLLKTGKQTIPCPRPLPCPHHKEGKGIYDLQNKLEAEDEKALIDGIPPLTNSDKLDGIFAFLEEIYDGVKTIAETLGVPLPDSMETEVERGEFQEIFEDTEEEVSEGTVDEKNESSNEKALTLDDIPPESKL